MTFEPQLDLPSGEHYIMDNKEYVVDERRGDKVLFKEVGGNIFGSLDDSELKEKFSAGSIVPIPSAHRGKALSEIIANRRRQLGAFPEKQQKIALKKLDYFKAINNAPRGGKSGREAERIIKEVQKKRGDNTKPSLRTIQRWYYKFVTSGYDPLTLLPRHAIRRPRKKRLNRLVRKAMNDAIERFYLSTMRHSVQWVYENALKEILVTARKEHPELSSELSTPSYTTFNREIQNYDPFLVMAAREGKQAADHHFRIKGKGLSFSRPLEMVITDSTSIDLIYVDDEGIPQGRLTLTLVADAFSRMILGFYLGPEEESYLTVMQALRHAIAPKTYAKKLYPSIQTDYPCHGSPEMVMADCGSENHNTSLPIALASLCCDLNFNPAGRPDLKAIIERLFGTINTGLWHNLMGTTKSNPKDRGKLDSVKEACLTLADIRRIFTQWTVDVYHNMENRELGMSPLQKWIDGCSQTKLRPPPSDEELTVLLAESTERKLQHYGIHMFGQLYRSNELDVLRKPKGTDQTVKIKFDPADISEIWVHDEENHRFIRAYADNQEYTKHLSKYQDKQIRVVTKAKYKTKRPTDEQLIKTRNEIFAETLAKPAKSKKIQRRRARMSGPVQEMPFGNNTSTFSDANTAERSTELFGPDPYTGNGEISDDEYSNDPDMPVEPITPECDDSDQSVEPISDSELSDDLAKVSFPPVSSSCQPKCADSQHKILDIPDEDDGDTDGEDSEADELERFISESKWQSTRG